MTVDQISALQGDGFVSVRPRSTASEARQALAHVAARALISGDRAGYRQTRDQLRLVHDVDASSRVLSSQEAAELNSLVELVDTPADIDWGSIYDDPDL